MPDNIIQIEETKEFHFGNKSRVYSTPIGPCASVTSIIQHTYFERPEKKESLNNWRKRLGEKQADRIRDEAAARGQLVHQAMEDYLMNRPSYRSNLTDHDTLRCFNAIKKHIDTINQPIAIEQAVYHPEWRYAGRIDLVCIINNALVLIDFKTSSKYKRREWIHHYFLQCAAYVDAYNTINPSGKISRIQIVIGVPDLENPLIYTMYQSDMNDVIEEYHQCCVEYYQKFPNLYDKTDKVIETINL